VNLVHFCALAVSALTTELGKVKCFLYTRWDVKAPSLLVVLHKGSVRDKV